MPGRLSASVVRRVTGTTSVDHEDDRRRQRDLTSVTRCKYDQELIRLRRLLFLLRDKLGLVIALM